MSPQHKSWEVTACYKEESYPKEVPVIFQERSATINSSTHSIVCSAVSHKGLCGAGAEKSSSQHQDPTVMSCIDVGKQPSKSLFLKASLWSLPLYAFSTFPLMMPLSNLLSKQFEAISERSSVWIKSDHKKSLCRNHWHALNSHSRLSWNNFHVQAYTLNIKSLPWRIYYPKIQSCKHLPAFSALHN